MPPRRLSTPVITDLLAGLARRESCLLLETSRVTGEDHRTLVFLEPREHLTCRAGDDPELFLRQVRERLGRGLYVAGWLAYELGYLLEPVLGPCRGAGNRVVAEFGVFGPPYIYDHRRGVWLYAGGGKGGRPGLPPELAGGGKGASGRYRIDNLRANQSREDYLEKIRTIKRYIEAGDTYQVNYTFKLLFDFHGSAEALYLALRRNQSVSYGAYLKRGERRIMSFSPELFFRKQGGTITVRPMKGTMRRGRTLAEDEELACILRNDIKNRSENVMIVDLLRNDLGRLSPPGGRLDGKGQVTVRSMFDVEKYETLLQMTSTITARVPDDLSPLALFKALFPCGSVTGAPKIRTMEIIRELETGERGVYTGAIGFLAPDGEAVFNVPIRTVVLEGGRGEMGVGSGIVHDSDPEAEWRECRLKGNFLQQPVPDFQLIETLLWRRDQGYWLLDAHLERLLDSAGYFDYPVEREEVVRRLEETAVVLRSGDGEAVRVRLTLDRDGKVEITAAPIEVPQVSLEPPVGNRVVEGAGEGEPPLVRLSDKPTDSVSPFLYHKTTLRDLYDRERQHAVAAGFYEVLFRNERDEITEGAITNIFIIKAGRWYTPPLASGLLNGIFRRAFLAANPGLVREAVLTAAELRQADAIYLANSVRGLVRVGYGR